MPNLVPPKIPDGERVDFDVSGGCGQSWHGLGEAARALMRELMTSWAGGRSLADHVEHRPGWALPWVQVKVVSSLARPQAPPIPFALRRVVSTTHFSSGCSGEVGGVATEAWRCPPRTFTGSAWRRT